MGRKSEYPAPNSPKNYPVLRRLLAALALFFGTGLFVIFTNLPSPALLIKSPQHALELIISLPISSSPQKPHPLPPKLAQWQDPTNSGDYFSQVTTTKVGYLVWSRFPVQVYVEPPKAASNEQAQAWIKGVVQAVQEWNTYLPLLVVEQPENADITIVQKVPPLQGNPPRARSAQTSYELYSKNNVLSHRFTILLSPSQTGEYVQAATRHELGHALGIWGHSPLQTDALYFSQVRQPPSISPRDVNTLKRIYEQPTSLGW
jgi:predicted Zn-dependent protease